MTTKRLAFTLAEIMIVLTIIGILTAILLPIAINSAPDENVMKFKKGNNTLGTVIRELVNSDQYYLNGDLGTKANGALLDGTHDGDYTYFCETFADIISTKKVECSEYKNYTYSFININWDNVDKDEYGIFDAKKTPDEMCKKTASLIGEGIVTTDDIVYYETSPGISFGITYYKNSISDDAIIENGESSCGAKGLFRLRTNAKNCEEYTMTPLTIYKIFCMDIDGINKGEDPFGYGIRIDGKILYGARAEEWLKKSIQKGE